MHREACREFPRDMQPVAHRNLVYLDSAEELADLQRLPGNHLEALKGDKTGLRSIRINDQYRLFFRVAETTTPSKWKSWAIIRGKS